jgi:hypothetical protein
MPTLSHRFYRYFIFAVGIIATIAYRVIVVLNHYSPVWVQIAWYIGTIGFVWYFAHRFKIEKKRQKLIERLQLMQRVNQSDDFSAEEKQALVYVLSSLQTSLARWNYIAIFVFSTLALLYGIYQDFSFIFG